MMRSAKWTGWVQPARVSLSSKDRECPGCRWSASTDVSTGRRCWSAWRRPARVTCRVYVPAAEAKEAARDVVEKGSGDEAQRREAVQENKPGGQSASLGPKFDWLSLVGIGTAHAQEQPDITIKTPAIQAIQSRMASRFDDQLRAHFDSGALGFANDGTINVRDANKIPLPQRVAVNQAVADQGRDAMAV